MKPITGQLVLLSSAVSILCGCSDPRAAGPTQARLDRINSTLTRLRDRENEGPRRLAAMGEMIAKDRRYHEERLARDFRELKTWSERDLRRWQERQPAYRAEITDQLDGDLQRANDTIPRLFY